MADPFANIYAPNGQPCGDPYSGIGCPHEGCTHDRDQRPGDTAGGQAGWHLCPNEPGCPHGRVLHDGDGNDEPFMCCAEGCRCGRRVAGGQADVGDEDRARAADLLDRHRFPATPKTRALLEAMALELAAERRRADEARQALVREVSELAEELERALFRDAFIDEGTANRKFADRLRALLAAHTGRG